MRRGDFGAAFAASDRVLRARDPVVADDPNLPYHLRWVWDGRHLAGRDVLVRCYHGLGDTLQFCRYLTPLQAVAATVTLEVQPELAPLLTPLLPEGCVHPFDPARPLPRGPCDVEIMELAHALRLPPSAAAYLRATPHPGLSRSVGFCWASGAWDPARSLPPHLLRSLSRSVPAISLQRGPEAGALSLHDPLNGSMDIAAIARVIAGLAAVVTVDTMIAHLAGALGRPVFLLLKHDPDWRWADRDGLWYANTRQYHQASHGDWTVAIATLQQDLAATLSLDAGS